MYTSFSLTHFSIADINLNYNTREKKKHIDINKASNPTKLLNYNTRKIALIMIKK